MHIPARHVKWIAPAVIVLIAGAVVWMMHGSGDDEMDSFGDAPAWTSPYAANSTLFGDAGRITPRPNDHTAVSFGNDSGTSADAAAPPNSSNGDAPRSGSGGYRRPAAQPAVATPARPTGGSPPPAAAPQAPPAAADPALHLEIPPYLPEPLFTPLPGAQTRGVAISEWESYRTDVAGKDILVTTDDSNFFRDRNGKLNGNTGDTDASGLNVTDATDSTIYGSESADEAPWQTVAQALVDILGPGAPSEDDDGDADEPDPDANPEDAALAAMSSSTGTDRALLSTFGPMQSAATTRGAAAAVITPRPTDDTDDQDSEDTDDEVDPDEDDDVDEPDPTDGFDFPYVEWTQQISSDRASAIHTDEGTTLASGADALAIGADGFDDDDNRAAGENIVITRDDGNVVVGGTGDVNAQIGDSEQGAVIMGVTRTFIKGGGAY